MRRYSKWLDVKQVSHFVGCDTEGTGEGTDHRLWVVRVGDALLHHDRPLNSLECLSFLCDRKEDRTTYVAYGMSYDVAMLLRDMPKDRFDLLVHRDRRAKITELGANSICAFPASPHVTMKGKLSAGAGETGVGQFCPGPDLGRPNPLICGDALPWSASRSC